MEGLQIQRFVHCGDGMLPTDNGEYVLFSDAEKFHNIAQVKAGECMKLTAERDKLKEALEYMVANIGRPVCLETRDGFVKAREALAGKLT